MTFVIGRGVSCHVIELIGCCKTLHAARGGAAGTAAKML